MSTPQLTRTWIDRDIWRHSVCWSVRQILGLHLLRQMPQRDWRFEMFLDPMSMVDLGSDRYINLCYSLKKLKAEPNYTPLNQDQEAYRTALQVYWILGRDRFASRRQALEALTMVLDCHPGLHPNPGPALINASV